MRKNSFSDLLPLSPVIFVCVFVEQGFYLLIKSVSCSTALSEECGRVNGKSATNMDSAEQNEEGERR